MPVPARASTPADDSLPGIPTSTSTSTPTSTSSPTVDQRARILDAALRLMAGGGVHAMSMRSLANACGLNVATLYHYFPSKHALLAQVIAHQNYQALLAGPLPIDVHLPVRERLSAFLDWIWSSMAEHDDMWKLLLGESLRGEEQALTSAAELSATFERALNDWLDSAFPDWPGERRVNARVLRGLIYGFFIEAMPMPSPERETMLSKRAVEIAQVLLPEPA